MEGGPDKGDLRRRVDEAFDEALDLPEGQVEAYLGQLEATDPDTHAEVRALWDAHARTEGLLEEPAMEAVASMADDALQSIRIGPYRTLREIGRGGMALVYLAERADGQFERQVAIKVIRGRPDALELHSRFLAERQILASLNHPNIAKLLDGGLSPGGLPYLVMEYVPGLPISEYCDRNRLSLSERLNLFRGVCEAVHYAHQNLIIHRDLKPTNILVTDDAKVKLLDFGIAKLLDPNQSTAPVTRTDHRIMTPEYASPEQVDGRPLTTGSDVYSLGIVLYQLLCGHRPYHLAQKSVMEVHKLVCERDPERPSTRARQDEVISHNDGDTVEIHASDVSAARSLSVERLHKRLKGDLDNIVMMALAKEPGRRYGSALLLGQDIERYLNGLPVTAHRGTTWYRASKFLRRNRAQSIAAALAAVSLIGGSLAVAWQGRIASRERDRAEVALVQAEQSLQQSIEVKDFLIGLFEANDPLEARGSTPTAGDLLVRGVDRVAELEGQPAVQAEMLDAVGRVYQSMGQFEEAQPFLARALNLRRSVYGTSDPVVAESLDRMGNILRLNGKYDEAEGYFREALALRRGMLGPDDPAIATSVTNLSVLLRTIGSYAEAEVLAREALGIWQRTLTGDDPELAYGLRNIGWLRSLQGDSEEAERFYREGLAMRRALVGDEHPDVVAMQILLADLQLARGDWQAAEAAYLNALEIRRAFLGDTHPYTASTINNLGLAAQVKGDPVAAEALHRQALDIWREELGEEHAYYAWGMNDLSMALHAQGRDREAEEWQRRSLRLRQELLGEGHPDIALSLHNLGVILGAQGRTTEGEELLADALVIRRDLLGAKHPDFAETLRELAILEEQMGRTEDAVAMFEEAAEVTREALGVTHERTLELYTDLARVHGARGDSEEAARYQQMAVGGG